MRTKIHDEAVELLLDAISQECDEGLRSGFMFGKPGAPHWEKNAAIDIYYRPNKLIRAALFVRKNGPGYLRYLPVGDIWSMLQRFVSDNFWYLADDVFLRFFSGTYANQVSPGAKAQFSEALATSPLFKPENELSLYPLVPVQVNADFNSDIFFLIEPSSLNHARLPSEIDLGTIAPRQYPPISTWEGRKEAPGAWLGIRSPVAQASSQMKAAILGALALTPQPGYRYLFSHRAMFGGYCTIRRDRISTTVGPLPHTPPMMHDINIGADDGKWLSILATKLGSNEKSIRRQIRGLQYFYRAWESEPSERFPILCMTLDAVFGDANQATQAVIDGVRSTLGEHVKEVRLRQLMDLRASVIHGGAPDVYNSRKYARYYDTFEADPIHDMELVVASCLRLKIFDGNLHEHPNPNAAIIADAQAKGRFPKKLLRNSILDDEPSSS